MQNSVSYHSYADDIQIYLALSLNASGQLEPLYRCTDQINNWMSQTISMVVKEYQIINKRKIYIVM